MVIRCKDCGKTFPEYKRILWKTFEKKYKPILNKYQSSAECPVYMFDTSDKEFKLLKRLADKFAKTEGGKNGYHVWTMVDGERDKVIILNGWHLVNRLGYLITEERWQEGEEIEVI
jgi:hypothetical protein